MIVPTRQHKGESELEYYNLLSPDDGPELEECEGCGDPLEQDELVDGLCDDCYQDWDGGLFVDDEEEDEDDSL